MTTSDEIKSIRFRVFRAVDNERICQKYIEGHIHVLKVYGITQITSANIEWILNPNAYVVVAEDPENDEVLAGARLHVADGKHSLPIEDAIGHKDPNVYPFIEKLHTEGGTGEFCGLWNSRKIAGYGIGSMFLGLTSVAVASQLGVKTLTGLCAPITKQRSFKLGFLQETSLGDNGEFIYPKEDLVATALLIPDLEYLSHATEEERSFMLSLRENWKQERVENTRRGEVMAYYDLEIPNITTSDSVSI